MKFIPMFLNFYGYDMGMKCHIYSCVEFIPITYHFIPPPSYPSFLPLIYGEDGYDDGYELLGKVSILPRIAGRGVFFGILQPSFNLPFFDECDQFPVNFGL